MHIRGKAMNWLERREELATIRQDIEGSDLPVQARRNLRRLLMVVDALNEELGSLGDR